MKNRKLGTVTNPSVTHQTIDPAAAKALNIIINTLLRQMREEAAAQ